MSFDGAGQADAEQAVDHDPVLATRHAVTVGSAGIAPGHKSGARIGGQFVGVAGEDHHRLQAALFEQARDHERVTAVIARPGEYQRCSYKPPLQPHCKVSRSATGALHQWWPVSTVRLFDTAQFGGTENGCHHVRLVSVIGQ